MTSASADFQILDQNPADDEEQSQQGTDRDFLVQQKR